MGQSGFLTLAAAGALLCVVGCEDVQRPTAPDDNADAPDLQVIACKAKIGAGTVECARPTRNGSSLKPLFDIVGGQGVNVQLTSANVNYDVATEVFYADVTVQNLRGSRLGTSDGSTVTGVRVFFHSGPTVTSGSGTVSVRNADGTGTFTAASQPYFEYAEMLGTGAVTGSKTWEWNVQTTVESFAFEVYVEGDVPPQPLPGLWQGRHSGVGYYSGTMGLVFSVNPEATGVTEITYYADDFGCAKSGAFLGFESKTSTYPGWPISDDDLNPVCNFLAGGALALCHTGTFNGEYISGTWNGTVQAPLGFCSDTWSAKPATRLYPRFDGSQRYLATDNAPPGESWIVTLEPGVTQKWIAVLDDSLKGDVVTFKLALRGDDGKVYLAFRANQSTFTYVNFDVSTEFMYYGMTDWKHEGWSELQGIPGQEVALWVTYQGTGQGGLLYGNGYESSIVVPGRIAVSPPSGTGSVAMTTPHEVSGRRIVTYDATGLLRMGR